MTSLNPPSTLILADAHLPSALCLSLPQRQRENYRTFLHPVFDLWMQMKPDLDKYRAMMPKKDCSIAEQDEVLLALWSAMEAIVDRAFNEHPSQQISHEPLKKFAHENPDLIE